MRARGIEKLFHEISIENFARKCILKHMKKIHLFKSRDKIKCEKCKKIYENITVVNKMRNFCCVNINIIKWKDHKMSDFHMENTYAV